MFTWLLPEPLKACPWWGCLLVCCLRWTSLMATVIQRCRPLCLWAFSQGHAPSSLWGSKGHIQTTTSDVEVIQIVLAHFVSRSSSSFSLSFSTLSNSLYCSIIPSKSTRACRWFSSFSSCRFSRTSISILESLVRFSNTCKTVWNHSIFNL